MLQPCSDEKFARLPKLLISCSSRCLSSSLRLVRPPGVAGALKIAHKWGVGAARLKKVRDSLDSLSGAAFERGRSRAIFRTRSDLGSWLFQPARKLMFSLFFLLSPLCLVDLQMHSTRKPDDQDDGLAFLNHNQGLSEVRTFCFFPSQSLMRACDAAAAGHLDEASLNHTEYGNLPFNCRSLTTTSCLKVSRPSDAALVSDTNRHLIEKHNNNHDPLARQLDTLSFGPPQVAWAEPSDEGVADQGLQGDMHRSSFSSVDSPGSSSSPGSETSSPPAVSAVMAGSQLARSSSGSALPSRSAPSRHSTLIDADLNRFSFVLRKPVTVVFVQRRPRCESRALPRWSIPKACSSSNNTRCCRSTTPSSTRFGNPQITAFSYLGRFARSSR